MNRYPRHAKHDREAIHKIQDAVHKIDPRSWCCAPCRG